jgi:hypothetical protein
MRKLLFWTMILLFALSSVLVMSSSVPVVMAAETASTWTVTEPFRYPGQTTRVIKLVWTAHSSVPGPCGGVSEFEVFPNDDLTGVTSTPLAGWWLDGMWTEPSGATPPTNGYEVYLFDTKGGGYNYDLLGGAGVDRSGGTNASSVTEQYVQPYLGNGVWGSNLIVSGVSAAIRSIDDESASGTIWLYLVR